MHIDPWTLVFAAFVASVLTFLLSEVLDAPEMPDHD